MFGSYILKTHGPVSFSRIFSKNNFYVWTLVTLGGVGSFPCCMVVPCPARQGLSLFEVDDFMKTCAVRLVLSFVGSPSAKFHRMVVWVPPIFFSKTSFHGSRRNLSVTCDHWGQSGDHWGQSGGAMAESFFFGLGMNEFVRVYPLHLTEYPNLAFRNESPSCHGVPGRSFRVWSDCRCLAPDSRTRHVLNSANVLWLSPSTAIHHLNLTMSLQKFIPPEHPIFFSPNRSLQRGSGEHGVDQVRIYLELQPWIDFYNYVTRSLAVLARWWHGQCWPRFCQFSRQTRRHHFLEAGNGKFVALVWIVLWTRSFPPVQMSPAALRRFCPPESCNFFSELVRPEGWSDVDIPFLFLLSIDGWTKNVPWHNFSLKLPRKLKN